MDSSMPHASSSNSFGNDDDGDEDEGFDDRDIQWINIDFDDPIWFVNFNVYFLCNIVELMLFSNVIMLWTSSIMWVNVVMFYYRLRLRLEIFGSI